MGVSGFNKNSKTSDLEAFVASYNTPATKILGAGVVVLGVAFFSAKALERDDAVLERHQEGLKATLTTDNTTPTTDLACRKNTQGVLEIFNVETGLTENDHVVQASNGQNCFFTTGAWKATGSTVYNADIF
jgi:hypothetical protein